MLFLPTPTFRNLWVVFLCLTYTGCATSSVETDVPKSQLPSEPPKIHRLTFESTPTQTGFPLRPSRESTVSRLTPKTEMREFKKTQAEAQTQLTAEKAPRVVEALGEKFAYFESESFPDMAHVCPSSESEKIKQWRHLSLVRSHV
jgi:hypothetical protein